MDTQDQHPVLTGRTLLLVLLISYALPLILFWAIVPQIRENSALKYVLTLVSASILGGVALWAMRKDGIALSALGLHRSKMLQAFSIPLLGWLLFAAILIPALIARGEDLTLFLGSPALIIQQWFFVGLAEELLCRGYLLQRFTLLFGRLPRIGRTLLAVLVVTAIFATLHLPVRLYNGAMQNGLTALWGEIVWVFVFGLVFAYIFLRTRNILLTAFIHGGLNAPLIGKSGDFAPLILWIIIIEVWRFFQKWRRPTS